MAANPTQLSETLERVALLAGEFEFRTVVLNEKGVSLLHLVQETGYPVFQDEITSAMISRALGGRGALLGAWLRYSAAKEANWGWFFERDPGTGLSVVGLRSGYSPETLGDIEDMWVACGYFIRHEIDAVLGSMSRLGHGGT